MGETRLFADDYICPDCKKHWIKCNCNYIPKKIDIDNLILPNEFTIIDIETTGMSRTKHAILEIGGVDVNLDNLRITKRFHAICNELPEKPVDPLNQWIFLNSNLQFAEVLNAPHFNKIKDELQNNIECSILTAFNKPFDFGFLTSRGIQITNSTTCLMQWTRKIIGFNHQKSGTKVPKAQEAWDFIFPNNPNKETHRALQDAEFEARITLGIWQILQRKI